MNARLGCRTTHHYCPRCWQRLMALLFALRCWLQRVTAAAQPRRVFTNWPRPHHILGMTIVYNTYRPKRARKRKVSPAMPQRIVTTAKKRAKPIEPGEPEAAPATPRIVTARNPNRSSRFGPVPDLTADEHQRRGDAAEALFRELVRRASAND